MIAAIAVGPVLLVVSAAFDRSPRLSGTDLYPSDPTLDNFHTILHSTGSVQFGRWMLNSAILASVTAVGTVLLGSLAAYAFSRFRFRGRRTGMLFLLLVQMFPQILLVVAIYLLMVGVTDIFPAIGLNTLAGLTLFYLGGALGVNAWLLKGFFDTIPRELDESARVDGATAGQIFWGVILPLATPVLAVVGLFSFVGVLNEYAIASVLLSTTDQQTLALGLQGYINTTYQENWGPFSAGVILAAIVPVLIFTYLQRYIVSGLTAGSVKG